MSDVDPQQLAQALAAERAAHAATRAGALAIAIRLEAGLSYTTAMLAAEQQAHAATRAELDQAQAEPVETADA